MRLSLFASAVSALLLPLTAPVAAQNAAKPKPVVAKPAALPATPRDQLKNQAKGLALATEVSEQISEGQMQAAVRVMTGDIACEFDQKVSLKAVEGHPGHFHLAFKKVTYRMIPQETTTGAVRLEDKRAGVVWLQIPAKSMLMNAKVGQRMVDACLHADQRAALEAATTAARSEPMMVPTALQTDPSPGSPASPASFAPESTGLGIAPKN